MVAEIDAAVSEEVDQLAFEDEVAVGQLDAGAIGVHVAEHQVDFCQGFGEASGGVQLEQVGPIAQTGVDRIAIGQLTHSAPALDLAMDLD